MGKDEKGDILRVAATLEDIKKSYGVASRLYGILEGKFEKGLREKGLELLSVREGEVVLEIGIGVGRALEKIAESVGATGKAYGIDITPKMLRLAEERLRRAELMKRVGLHEGDARTMPYKDNMFDAVYTAATLELFDTPDIPRVLGEIKRVLKPSGRLSVISLTKEGRESFWFLRFYEWMHQRLPKYASCRPIYVEQIIQDAGFDIAERQEFMIMKLVPMKLVIAMLGGTSNRASANKARDYDAR
ncbi:class I SAM-dependent methyltransferase [Chloroflexota bacterium]